jgi:hypothetical protein
MEALNWYFKRKLNRPGHASVPRPYCPAPRPTPVLILINELVKDWVYSLFRRADDYHSSCFNRPWRCAAYQPPKHQVVHHWGEPSSRLSLRSYRFEAIPAIVKDRCRSESWQRQRQRKLPWNDHKKLQSVKRVWYSILSQTVIKFLYEDTEVRVESYTYLCQHRPKHL